MNNKLVDSNKIYWLGLMFFSLAMACLGLVLYCIPYAFFGIKYEVPLFIMHVMHHIEVTHSLHGKLQLALVLLPFLLFALVFFLIAKEYTRLYEQTLRRPDDKLKGNNYATEAVKAEQNSDTRNPVLLPILFGIAGILLLLSLVDWFFSLNY